MKKISWVVLIAVALSASAAWGYCSILSLRSQQFQYGHLACAYSDGTTSVTVNVRMGEVCPSYISYDQWTGAICGGR